MLKAAKSHARSLIMAPFDTARVEKYHDIFENIKNIKNIKLELQVDIENIKDIKKYHDVF